MAKQGKCHHPLESLELDAGRSGQRGSSSVYCLVCSACDERLHGAVGLKQLVASVVSDSDALWVAVKSLGGSRSHVPSDAPAKLASRRRPCEHYLSWIRVDGGDAVRGGSGNFYFRCVGCKQQWIPAPGIRVFLAAVKAELVQIKSALRGLGAEL